jgi:hypothetical protein
MNSYVILLRGVNVGGKDKVPMAVLRKCLEELEFSDVSTGRGGEVCARNDAAGGCPRSC